MSTASESAAERQARMELAALFHIALRLKWTDLIYTHFSARIPGTDYLLINPFGLFFQEITPGNLVKIDMKGNILADSTGLGINQAGFVIHGCIHQARPDVHFVLHTHTRAGVAVSAQKWGLLPISQHASRVRAQLTYHDYEGIALNPAEQERIVRDLGASSKAMILRNHGLLAMGGSAPVAFDVMYYLEAACQIQVDALSGGRDALVEVPLAQDELASRQFERPGGTRMQLTWDAWLRELARDGVLLHDS